MKALRRRPPASATAARRPAVPLVAFFALILMWPAYVNGGALLFHDSEAYVSGGLHAWAFFGELVRSLSGAVTDGAAEAAASSGSVVARSLAYSLFALPLFWAAPLGLAVAAAQALLAAVAIYAFIGEDLRPGLRFLILIGLAALTPLPIFASYLMPDVFAGLAIVVTCLVVSRAERLDWLGAAALAAAGGAFAAFHLSHLPLSGALGVAGLAALIFMGGLRAPGAFALLAPPLLAAAVNLVGSAIAFDEPSVTPKRLPVALARALADGPARRHVEVSCASDPQAYALCAIIDRLPEESGEILFGANGFRAVPGGDAYDRLRAEEPVILARAAAAEPLVQIKAFTANTVEQLETFGLADVGWSRLRVGPNGDWNVDLGLDSDRAAWRILEAAHATALVAALGALLVFAARDRLAIARDERGLLFVVLVGLVVNAAICGGLSAPADRYGARVVWVLPLLVALMAARRVQGRRREEPSMIGSAGERVRHTLHPAHGPDRSPGR